ncbi:MAG: hypothetical protein V3U76_19825 [Granulosicoccus sp.]
MFQVEKSLLGGLLGGKVAPQVSLTGKNVNSFPPTVNNQISFSFNGWLCGGVLKTQYPSPAVTQSSYPRIKKSD